MIASSHSRWVIGAGIGGGGGDATIDLASTATLEAGAGPASLETRGTAIGRYLVPSILGAGAMGIRPTHGRRWVWRH